MRVGACPLAAPPNPANHNPALKLSPPPDSLSPLSDRGTFFVMPELANPAPARPAGQPNPSIKRLKRHGDPPGGGPPDDGFDSSDDIIGQIEEISIAPKPDGQDENTTGS